MEELKLFEADLRNNPELRKQLEEAIRRIAEEGQAQSDGEVMVKTVKELGYELSIAAHVRAVQVFMNEEFLPYTGWTIPGNRSIIP